MKARFFVTILLFSFAIVNAQEINTKFDNPIKVLNMGTFHMGFTSDANRTEFDEHNKENIRQVHKIAQAIAEFKPTVILVEYTPEYQSLLENNYEAYLKNPETKFEKPTEVELLAYEIGRLSNTKRIYGIDYKEGYNYMIAQQLKEIKDTETYKKYLTMIGKLGEQFPEDKMTLLEKLKLNNNPLYLDFLMNINADMLTHISTEGEHQGADEAAKFYHRNLVMYSNMNQIQLTESDRVFILMGATHTAFFKMWLERSPKYQLVNIYDYLK
jgi:hypothetical protein